jgi:hypothetical protein
MRARCYPFDMETHRFYGRNVKVCESICLSWYTVNMVSIY